MAGTTYICPMHPEVRQEHAGICPVCKMDLTLEGSEAAHGVDKRSIKDFLPLIVMFFLIGLFVGVRQIMLGELDAFYAVGDFMAGFFLIFGFFKMLNWKGFVNAYSTYDLLATRSRAYGYLYPIIELSLGFSYLFRLYPTLTNTVTLTIMVIGAIGVVGELRKKNQIPCACLGVVFKIPMTMVTFIEDVLMAVMAALMLIFT